MAKPLLNIHCITEPYCEYPVAVKLVMDDGSVQEYELKNKTTFQFNNIMKCLNRMKVGYQYNYPTKRRSRIHRGKL